MMGTSGLHIISAATNIFFGDLRARQAVRLTTVQPVCAMSCSQGYPAAAGLVCKNIFPPQRECFHFKKEFHRGRNVRLSQRFRRDGNVFVSERISRSGKGIVLFSKDPRVERLRSRFREVLRGCILPMTNKTCFRELSPGINPCKIVSPAGGVLNTKKRPRGAVGTAAGAFF